MRHRFTPPLDITTILEFAGSMPLSKDAEDVHQAPRAPLPSQGVTSRGVTSNVTWKGIAPSSSLMLAHASDQNPPTGSSSLCRWVFAGCCQSLLGDGPSRRYLCESFPGCKDPYRGGSQVAFTRCFPCDIGLPQVPTRSAPTTSAQRFQSGVHFRGCSHSLMFQPPGLLATLIAPTAPARRAGGQPWRFRPSRTRAVTAHVHRIS